MIMHMKQATKVTSDFTFEDLIKLNISFDSPEVQEVYKLALQDDYHLSTLNHIKSSLDTHTMTLTQLPNSPEIYILSEARDVTKDILEDFLVQLKKMKQHEQADRDMVVEAQSVEDRIIELGQVIEMLEDAGKMLLYLDGMFSSKVILSSLHEKHQKYQGDLQSYQGKLKLKSTA